MPSPRRTFSGSHTSPAGPVQHGAPNATLGHAQQGVEPKCEQGPGESCGLLEPVSPAPAPAALCPAAGDSGATARGVLALSQGPLQHRSLHVTC